MSVADHLAAAIKSLELIYAPMARAVGSPKLVEAGPTFWYRYETHTPSLLCFLKGAKLVSTLNAAIVLLRAGHTQEVGVLCRVADDCCNDIIFMLLPRDGDKLSSEQERFLKEFFQEEFANPADPFGSRQKRDVVPRRHIHAAFSATAKEVANPSDVQNIAAVLHGTFSGYVHGAYPHVMELFGGRPGHFHLSGMHGAPPQREFERQLVQLVYRAIMASDLVSRKLCCADEQKTIRLLLGAFEATFGFEAEPDVESMMKKAKQPQHTF